jgi:hypothetical protein
MRNILRPHMSVIFGIQTTILILFGELIPFGWADEVILISPRGKFQ